MALAMSVEGGQQLPPTSQLPSQPATSPLRQAGPNGAAAAASASLAGTSGAANSVEAKSVAAPTKVAGESSQTTRSRYPARTQVGWGACYVLFVSLGSQLSGTMYKGRGRFLSCCCMLKP